MESDSFFCRLFKQLPQTLFELLRLSPTQAKSYRFDSVELKKALRIDGLFIPKKRKLPVYFVEVQFQRVRTFYANLFAKVFCYLEENEPSQNWIAVAIFPSRSEEPRELEPYQQLLQSSRVIRIYLDEAVEGEDPPIGLGILQLLFASVKQAQELAPRIVRISQEDSYDSEQQRAVVELVEELLLQRFPELDREAMRMKFKLHDIRESKVWKEAHNEGREEGREQGIIREREVIVRKCRAKGMTDQKIADLLDLELNEVRRLGNGHTKK